MDHSAAAVQWHLHPEVWALCAFLLVGYAVLVRRYGPVFHPKAGERAVTPFQVTSFVSGVVVLWIASASPLHDIAEGFLFSAHMIQHLLQALIVPPLLLMGTPRWMAEMILAPRGLVRVVRALAAPLVAGLIFNGVLMFIHWPAVVDAMLSVEWLHASSHVLVLAAGMLMWLPVLSPLPAVPRISPVAQMGYLFLMTFLPTIPASFLTFGDTPLYRSYEAFPRLWGISALDDMRMAGLIMKIGGGFLLTGVITVLFFRWAGEQEREQRREDALATPRTPSDQPSI